VHAAFHPCYLPRLRVGLVLRSANMEKTKYTPVSASIAGTNDGTVSIDDINTSKHGHASTHIAEMDRGIGVPQARPQKTQWQFWSPMSLFTQAFSFCWLCVTCYLLVLNFSSHIVGLSVGCISSKCRLNVHSPSQYQQAQVFAKYDRNALGGLQFAAKLLDTWFLTIMCTLVYGMIKIYSSHDSRYSLPVGYLHAHVDLGNMRSFVKLLTDRVPETFKENRKIQNSSLWCRKRLYALICFIAFVCFLCNIMGVALALLLLPTQQWHHINDQAPAFWFEKLNSEGPPRDNASFPTCSQAELNVGLYNCTGNLTLAALNALTASALATSAQAFVLNQSPEARSASLNLLPLLQEGNVSFSFNVTGSTTWSPNRESLRSISVALTDYDTATLTDQVTNPNFPDSNLYSRSPQVRLQLTGPTIGQKGSCYRYSTNTTQGQMISATANNRTVRCNLSPAARIAKCIPTGGGWDDTLTNSTQYGIPDIEGIANLTVSIYAASVGLDMELSKMNCLVNKNCSLDWDAAFGGRVPGINSTGPQQMFEYNTRVTPIRAWCDTSYQLTFASYDLNPSPLSNPLKLTQLNILEQQGERPFDIFLHPHWNLASMSAARGGNVSNVRESAITITRSFKKWVNSNDPQVAWEFTSIHKLLTIQALSMVSFSTTNVAPLPHVRYPKLDFKATVQLWKYDIESRGSKLAVVVLVLGWICVIAQMALYKNDIKDATEILTTHVERCPPPEEYEEHENKFPILKYDSSTKKIAFYG